MKTEYRFMPTEIRMEQEEDGPPRVVGFGPVYGKKSQNLGDSTWQFYEIIEPGAFAESIEAASRNNARPIKSYFNHDPNNVLATTRSNPPLKIMDTPDGVAYDAEIPPTSYGRDLEINLDRKNVEGSSFAFQVLDDEWKEEKKDDIRIVTRRVIKGELFELGPVTDPAYLQAPASLRSAHDIFAEYREKIAAEAANKPEPVPPAEPDAQPPTQVELLRRELELLSLS
ncbi:MAG: HK97 family phage prohead protease [Anaerovoracaceae bacterium]